jgi:23S rRNA (cytosine1962-C5)-methyltransferase
MGQNGHEMGSPEVIMKECILTATILVELPSWDQYELLDSGDGRRLERIGGKILIRPEPKAWWKPDIGIAEWRSAGAIFEVGQGWEGPDYAPGNTWKLSFDGTEFVARFGSNKHIGVFPEQSSQWRWLSRRLAEAGRPIRVLNLFGYTGIASLVAAQFGAEVTHVDASKPAIAWGKENVTKFQQERFRIRWIVDDVQKFVSREIRRGNFYDAILLDPPAFGRGPKQEVWKSDSQLADLLASCRQLLSDRPLALLCTAYSIDASSMMLKNVLADAFGDGGGTLEVGEIGMGSHNCTKILSVALFGRISWR